MASFATDRIRTVALVGDGAAGKTSLAEAMLARAGAIATAGSVECGTTVSDHDPLEKSYQHVVARVAAATSRRTAPVPST